MLRFVAYLVVGGLPASCAGADEFSIELRLQAGAALKTAQGQAAALGVKPKPREVVRVKARQPLRVDWTLKNVDAAKTFKNVIVHFVTVKQDRQGQLNVPKLDKGVVAESAVTVDFNPKESARGRLVFAVETPGSYLMRLETIGVAAGADGQEYFAALDLMVE